MGDNFGSKIRSLVLLSANQRNSGISEAYHEPVNLTTLYPNKGYQLRVGSVEKGRKEGNVERTTTGRSGVSLRLVNGTSGACNAGETFPISVTVRSYYRYTSPMQDLVQMRVQGV